MKKRKTKKTIIENCCENNKQSITQKILQWLKRNFTATVIGLVLSVIGIVLTIYFGTKDSKEPFTATIQITNWDIYHETFLPTIKLEIDGKIIEEQINEKGIVKFTDIESKNNDKEVPIEVINTQNMPFYFESKTIKIYKDSVNKIEVLLRGLDKFQGTVIDNISGEGLPDVSVTLAGISTTTDEKGNFNIEIPIEKQRKEQEVEISKDRYKSIRQTVPMSGEHKHRTILERK